MRTASRVLSLLLLLCGLCAGTRGEGDLTGYRVCIDPGHQGAMDARLEPLAPGSTEFKARVAGCARGVVSHARESAVNLEIALLLRDALEARGAEVLLCRETEDAEISNVQRANMANVFGADVFFRLHCNASDNASNRGFRIYAPVRSAAQYYGASKEQMIAWGEMLCECLLRHTEQTRAYAYAGNTYSGSNWARVPTFLVEMGYLSNAEDDRLLQTDAYRAGVVAGLCDFVAAMPQGMCREVGGYENALLYNMKSEERDVAVYEAKDETSARIATVSRRYRLYALNDEGGGWYLVQTTTGKIGYARSETLVPCK